VVRHGMVAAHDMNRKKKHYHSDCTSRTQSDQAIQVRKGRTGVLGEADSTEDVD
jgi:hypothetical protein